MSDENYETSSPFLFLSFKASSKYDVWSSRDSQ